MNHYCYGATLRPWTELNLRRLQACDAPVQGASTGYHYRFGIMAFHRKMTDFEVSQFDLTFLGLTDGTTCHTQEDPS